MDKTILDDDVQKYIHLLEKGAEVEITETCSQDFAKSILIFSEIITKDGTSFELIVPALTYLNKLFTPVPPITEDNISQKWLIVDEKQRNKVKTAILTTINSPNEQVIQNTSKVLISLFNIEKIHFLDFIPKLIELLDNTESSEHVKSSLISTLTEISLSKFFYSQTQNQQIQELQQNIFNHTSIFFAETQNKSIDFLYSSAHSILSFLTSVPQIFEKRNEMTSLLIDISIQNLNNIPQVNEDAANHSVSDLHFTILSILLKILENNYTNTNFDPSRILQYTVDQIMNYTKTPNNQYVINNLLRFWTDLAEYEYKIIKYNMKIDEMKEKSNRINKKNRISFRFPEYRVYNQICEIGMKKMTTKLLNIMFLIDPNDLGAEDIQVKMPHMFSNCLLKYFFIINPFYIFDQIKPMWLEVMSDYVNAIKEQTNNDLKVPFKPPPPINWMRDHALLLTIPIMCHKLNKSFFYKFTEVLRTFFFSPVFGNYYIIKDYLIGTCLMSNQIPKITDTCLFSLGQIAQLNPRFFTPEAVDLILTWIKENKNVSDSIIFSRILELANSILDQSTWDQISTQIQKKLLNSIQLFTELFHIGISRPDAMTTNSIYNSSYIMIRNVCIILFSSDSSQNFISSDSIHNFISSDSGHNFISSDSGHNFISSDSGHNFISSDSRHNFISSDSGHNFILSESGHDFFSGLIQSEIQKLNGLINSEENDVKRRVNIINYLFQACFMPSRKVTDFNEFAEQIAYLYLKMITPNSQLIKEAIVGLGFILRYINFDNNDLLQKTNDKITIALQSTDQFIVSNTFCLREIVNDMFIKYKLPGYVEIMKEFLKRYNEISNYMMNSDIPLDLTSLLLNSISLLLSSHSEFIKNEHADSINSFIQPYQKLLILPLSFQNDKDFEKANMFYSAMFKFEISILKCLEKELYQNRKLMKSLMESTSHYMRDLAFHFDNSSMNCFLAFLNQYNSTFGCCGNIILNQRVNYNLILHALCFDSEDIKDNAESTLNMILHS